MFQYAFGRSVALARKEEVAFVLEPQPESSSDWYEINRWWYALNLFHIPVNFGGDTPPPSTYIEHGFQFNPEVYTQPPDTLFDGYWQTERYFNVPLVHELFFRRDLSEPSHVVAEEIKAAGTHSAFLHVRRGNYLGKNTEFHRTQTADYYSAAVNLIRNGVAEVKFFVFSDDPEWCKSTFPTARIIDHNSNKATEEKNLAHEDIWLMSLCQHGIIANSSFSWWGAWLGGSRPGRIIVAPKQWFGPKLAHLNTSDLIPQRWQRI